MVMSANTFTNLQQLGGRRTPAPGDLESVTRLAAERGGGVSASDYIRGVQTFHRTGRQLGAFFEKYDVLLSTTIARASLPLGTVRTDGPLEQFDEAVRPMTRFTAVCNATGVPAMSMTIVWSYDSLSIGLHFVGRLSTAVQHYSLF